MEINVDVGTIISGIAALVSVVGALRKRSSRLPKNVRQELPKDSPKTPYGQALSDSQFMRLAELWEGGPDER